MSTRDVSQESPSLFEAPPAGDQGTGKLARDFVKWCFSFGADFRNSPDVTNLRYWARKDKVKIKDREEAEILETARTLYLKRIEQATRKADAPN